jgi:hypothetical protein
MGKNLDSVGTGLDQYLDDALHVLDAGQKAPFAEKTMIDGHIKTLAIGSKKTIHAVLDAHRYVYLFAFCEIVRWGAR